MEGKEEWIELKFRLADGSDIGPNKYSESMTVSSLKQKIISQWPKDKGNTPKNVNDVTLINGGKILENNKTLAQSTFPIGDMIITMHVVLRPPNVDKKSEKLQNDPEMKNRCGCTIL